MAKIKYEDKEFLNKNESIADKNKVNDTDLNEIKNVVNENDDSVGNLSNLNTNDKSNLINAINSTLPVILYETDKTYSATSTNTKITLTDDITKYKRVVLYGLQNERCFGSCEINDPQVNDKFSMFIASSGSRGGYYAFNSVVRLFTISNNKEITYGNATTLTSHTASQNNLQGFVLDTDSLKIYKIIGFKN